MKQILNNYAVLWFGIISSIVTAVGAEALHISGAQAVIIALLQIILATCVEVLIRIKNFKILALLPASAIQSMLARPQIAAMVQHNVDNYVRAHALRHPVLQEELRRVVNDHARDLESLAEGGYVTRPTTRPYFRDLSVVDGVKFEMLAVSMSNPESYWDTVSGQNYLMRQAQLRKRLKAEHLDDGHEPIRRIFICQESEMLGLVKVLTAHRNAEIPAFVAVYEELPADLRRDFYVLDREFVTYLETDANGETLKAGFYVRGGRMGDEVDAAIRRFDSLTRYCRTPDQIPQLRGYFPVNGAGPA